jgi:hypothetical protein
MAKP